MAEPSAFKIGRSQSNLYSLGIARIFTLKRVIISVESQFQHSAEIGNSVEFISYLGRMVPAHVDLNEFQSASSEAVVRSTGEIC